MNGEIGTETNSFSGNLFQMFGIVSLQCTPYPNLATPYLLSNLVDYISHY